MSERDEAGFLAFLKQNKELGKREVASVAYHTYGFRISDVEKFINEWVDSGSLMEVTYHSGRRGRPKVIVTGSD